MDAFDERPSSKRKANPLPLFQEESTLGRFPKWLHVKLPEGNEVLQTEKTLKTHRLHTVCEEAKCPNRLECFSKKTATFLVLGKSCTRACGFCDIDFDKTPTPPDPLEPERILDSVKQLGLKHVVITQVARDDLSDGGAAHIQKILEHLRSSIPSLSLEVLTSDFQGNFEAIDTVLSARPHIYNYNLETTRRLTPSVRHTATYERTLKILRYIKDKQVCQYVKSGIMVGLGESPQEVFETLQDLQQTGCDIVTIGQYLQPSKHTLRVKEFITPEQFEQYALFGKQIGIPYVFASPFMRSSYNAKEIYDRLV